ncbi:19886_t:CDS:2, partial [Racocetra persica]
ESCCSFKSTKFKLFPFKGLLLRFIDSKLGKEASREKSTSPISLPNKLSDFNLSLWGKLANQSKFLSLFLEALILSKSLFWLKFKLNMEKNFVVESELKVEKPLTLEQIKDIIEKQDFNRFYRSSEIEEKYQKDQKDKEMLIPTKLKEIIELKHYEKSNNTER